MAKAKMFVTTQQGVVAHTQSTICLLACGEHIHQVTTFPPQRALHSTIWNSVSQHFFNRSMPKIITPVYKNVYRPEKGNSGEPFCHHSWGNSVTIWNKHRHSTFKCNLSPGMDGIMPIMLQQGFELLAGKLLMLLRTSLALGYIPMSSRHTRVVFIPKPGKSLTQAKSLRPISLMSLYSKYLRNLLIDISGEVSWLKNHFTRTSMPIGQVCPQRQLSYRLFKDWKSA